MTRNHQRHYHTLLSAISSFIWGPPYLFPLSGTGLSSHPSFRVSYKLLFCPRALSYLFARGRIKAGIYLSLRHLGTALEATIGTGNIVGVATGSTSGGPGAIFDVVSCIIRHGNQIC